MNTFKTAVNIILFLIFQAFTQQPQNCSSFPQCNEQQIVWDDCFCGNALKCLAQFADLNPDNFNVISSTAEFKNNTGVIVTYELQQNTAPLAIPTKECYKVEVWMDKGGNYELIDATVPTDQDNYLKHKFTVKFDYIVQYCTKPNSNNDYYQCNVDVNYQMKGSKDNDRVIFLLNVKFDMEPPQNKTSSTVPNLTINTVNQTNNDNTKGTVNAIQIQSNAIEATDIQGTEGQGTHKVGDSIFVKMQISDDELAKSYRLATGYSTFKNGNLSVPIPIKSSFIQHKTDFDQISFTVYEVVASLSGDVDLEIVADVEPKTNARRILNYQNIKRISSGLIKFKILNEAEMQQLEQESKKKEDNKEDDEGNSLDVAIIVCISLLVILIPLSIFLGVYMYKMAQEKKKQQEEAQQLSIQSQSDVFRNKNIFSNNHKDLNDIDKSSRNNILRISV